MHRCHNGTAIAFDFSYSFGYEAVASGHTEGIGYERVGVCMVHLKPARPYLPFGLTLPRTLTLKSPCEMLHGSKHPQISDPC